MALVAFETLLTPVEVADSWRPPLDGLDESDSPDKKIMIKFKGGGIIVNTVHIGYSDWPPYRRLRSL